jgi:hypothetical protein
VQLATHSIQGAIDNPFTAPPQGAMPSATKMVPKMTKNQLRRAKKKEQKKAEVSLNCAHI